MRRSQYPIRGPLGEFSATSIRAAIRATYPDEVAELLDAPEPPSKQAGKLGLMSIPGI